jgi:hypothetical protein
MNRITILVLFVALLVVSMVSYAGMKQEKSDLNSLKMCTEAVPQTESVTTNSVVASDYAANDQPCYVGGKYVGNCSQSSPFYNALNGECYSRLQDCKKADGDLSSTSGSGSCVRCGK